MRYHDTGATVAVHITGTSWVAYVASVAGAAGAAGATGATHAAGPALTALISCVLEQLPSLTAPGMEEE